MYTAQKHHDHTIYCIVLLRSENVGICLSDLVQTLLWDCKYIVFLFLELPLWSTINHNGIDATGLHSTLSAH